MAARHTVIQTVIGLRSIQLYRNLKKTQKLIFNANQKTARNDIILIYEISMVIPKIFA